MNDDAALKSIGAMLHPASIAIIGATERQGYGARFMNNLIRMGTPSRLYPVNPGRETVFGHRCYASARDIPEPVDLAAIIVSADQVLPAFRECVENGARSVLVISAGFAETGTAAGAAAQAELRDIARSSGIRTCGPNCLGFANVPASNWITSSPRIDFDSPVRVADMALVSQSGATCYSTLLAMAHDRGIGFRYLVATGNEADLESSDFLRYMLLDPGIRAVAAVIEGFKDGQHFMRVADLAAEVGKPIVVLKIGRSDIGSHAAKTHTAAMTGSDIVHDALFRQKAVVRVDDYDELLETTAMFAKTMPPRGGRVGVVSESGGMGSFTADICGQLGLAVPPLSADTQRKMVAIMGTRGAAANPADLTLFGIGPEFPAIFDIFVRDEHHDLVVMSTIGGEGQAQGFIDAVADNDKPILVAWTGSAKRAGLESLRTSDVPLFSLPGKAALAARRLVDYHRTRQRLCAEASERSTIAGGETSRGSEVRQLMLSHLRRPLSEYESKRVLSAGGVEVASSVLCSDRRSMLAQAKKVGYPLALKVVSREIAHKTEVGGVRLGLRDRGELTAACDEMMASICRLAGEVAVDGFLLEPMVEGGVEVVVGVSRDAQFGPVLMLGLGGIFAEALASASWRVCPVIARDAQEMVSEVRGLATILAGARGQGPYDVDALLRTLVAVSRLATECGDLIETLDINPLSVLPAGRGAIALDALVVPVAAESARSVAVSDIESSRLTV